MFFFGKKINRQKPRIELDKIELIFANFKFKGHIKTKITEIPFFLIIIRQLYTAKIIRKFSNLHSHSSKDKRQNQQNHQKDHLFLFDHKLNLFSSFFAKQILL